MLTKKRAEAIWAKRGIQNTLSDDLFTFEELHSVYLLWQSMSGDSCFMTAFFEFLNGRAPVQQFAKMRAVKVYFDDGDTLTTNINGSLDDIADHYLGVDFEKSDETTHKAVKVEFLDPNLSYKSNSISYKV